MNRILDKMPEVLRSSLNGLNKDIISNLEEIRLQTNQPVRIISSGKEAVLDYITSQQVLVNTLSSLLNHSVYAYEENLANGFVTIEGGHRVGICGRVVTENGKIQLIKEISSLNIRRSRAITGVSDKVMKYIFNRNAGLQNTIIVSPPKCGKTTLLRDIARSVSEMGLRVGICDERSEIAGMYQGAPSYDLGPRTDVLDGCIKSEGMIMLIRSMSPDVIVTDEIGRSEDVSAIEAATCAGVKIITTIHGNNYGDLMASKIGPLIQQGVFRCIIFLSNIPATGSIREVKNV